MPNEIALQMPFADMERLAHSIAKSGLFGIKTPDQAIVLMMIAQAEGRHPAEAARDYDVIQGRPAKKAEAMLRDFLQAGGKVEWHTLSDEMADATFAHPQGGTARISWDMRRAATAGLTGKDNYKKFPRQMLRSRTVSEGVRTVWPLATSGMYESGETADMTPFAGTTIEAEPQQPQHQEPAPPKSRTAREWLDAFEIAMRSNASIGDVNRLISHPETQRAKESFANKPEAKQRMDRIIADGLAKHAPIDDGDSASEDGFEDTSELAAG